MASTRKEIIYRMQSKVETKELFNFESLTAPPLYSLLSYQDINQLHRIASSIKYSGNLRKKKQMIDDVMKSRGFIKLAGGTNRVVYRFIESDKFVIKVAIDNVGIGDNPREFYNQNLFKPYIAKCFDVDPSGTVGLFERVNPITSREEFMSVADDIYKLILDTFIGKYVMADIGTQFFMNYGVRITDHEKGPVLVDYPYVYELVGNRLFCTCPDPNSPTGLCGGEIDYDDGYNYLYCTKCGQKYHVADLGKKVSEEQIKIITKYERRSNMKINVRRGAEVVTMTENTVLKPAVNKIITPDTPNPFKYASTDNTIKPKRLEARSNRGEGDHEKKQFVRGQVTQRPNKAMHVNNPVKLDKKQSKEIAMEEVSKKLFGVKSFDVETGTLVLVSGDFEITANISNSEVVTKLTANLKKQNEKNIDKIEELEKGLKDSKIKIDNLNVELTEAKKNAASMMEVASSTTDQSDVIDALKLRNEELQRALGVANTELGNINREPIDPEDLESPFSINEFEHVRSVDATIGKMSDIFNGVEPDSDYSILRFEGKNKTATDLLDEEGNNELIITSINGIALDDWKLSRVNSEKKEEEGE